MKNHIIGAVSRPMICKLIVIGLAGNPGYIKSAMWSIVIAIIAIIAPGPGRDRGPPPPRGPAASGRCAGSRKHSTAAPADCHRSDILNLPGQTLVHILSGE